MLVLSRQVGEGIRVGDVLVKIASVKGNKVRIAVDAPTDLPVHREEIYAAQIAENGRVRSLATRLKDASVPRGAERTEDVGLRTLDPASGIRHSASGSALSTQSSAQAGGA